MNVWTKVAKCVKKSELERADDWRRFWDRVRIGNKLVSMSLFDVRLVANY